MRSNSTISSHMASSPSTSQTRSSQRGTSLLPSRVRSQCLPADTLSGRSGGVAFSNFGDRLGRRSAFLVSLMGISLATTGMALCPTYETWGVWATAIFVTLRLLQGFCLGGELPGAITYVSKAATPGRAGLVCGLLFCCASLGVVLASGVNAGLHSLMPAPAVAEYGWRLAFALGGLLGLLSYLPRKQLAESPVFMDLRER